MSFFDNEEATIYRELDGKGHSNASKIIQKVLGIVLTLSIGFAVGNIYSVSNNKQDVSNNNSSVNSKLTSSTNSNLSVVSSNATNGLSVAEIASLVSDSVVEISVSATSNSYFGSYTTTGSGSGVIISEDGYVLTNNHVISGASEINVRLKNGTEYIATLVGKDSKTDVAVLKIEASNLTAAVIGDSSKLQVGDLAVVIGNPLGQLGGTVTDGIISALEREINLDGTTMNLIQTNAAINPGNSGGGLFNSRGELVGIVVAKSSGLDVEGLGFVIPINDVSSEINDILNLGYVSGRPFLGVSLSDSSSSSSTPIDIFDFFSNYSSQSRSYGPRVTDVVEGSAAEEAGIKVGDNIVSIDGTSNPDPPTYVNDQEVDLTQEGSWVQWNDGFNITGDMLARAWFRSPNEYTTLIQFSNTRGQTIKMNFMLGYESVESTELEAYVELYVTSVTGSPYYLYSNYVTPVADTDQYVVYLTRVNNIYSLQLLTA